jgi:hypothetical protein
LVAGPPLLLLSIIMITTRAAETPTDAPYITLQLSDVRESPFSPSVVLEGTQRPDKPSGKTGFPLQLRAIYLGISFKE